MIIHLLLHAAAYGELAGGRLNSFSRGDNAFAGVVNPANAVWIEDRLDVGAFVVHQKSSLDNRDDNPRLPPGKIDLAYRSKNTFNADAAIHKQMQWASFSLASYTLPSFTQLRTKEPLPIAGVTPIVVRGDTNAVSGVFSFKLGSLHSIGCSLDYFYLNFKRNGFQNTDNPLRSVSPGNVTNNGTDHSGGIGFGIGWRWKITENLDFGAAYAKKSFCGQFRRYRGFEPHHAKNFIPQSFGAGFTCRFAKRFAARLEMLWLNLWNLPGANNTVLSDGSLNLHKRGSSRSPGPGLQDALFINMGLGMAMNKSFALGAGYSHRIKHSQKTADLLSHTYRLQTIYDIISLGGQYQWQKHSVFGAFSYGFRTRVSGVLPEAIGGGAFTAKKQNVTFSVSWGYLL